ncbi:MAG: ribokinase [Candidatus Omnitrophica bacterium]|nr:ribokinase [Candidatus Omnitrophota bacterium]
MICVVGSSNTDFTIKVERHPSVGETVMGEGFFISGGGKGANQACAIARLGGRSALIANIGDDRFGLERIKDLRRCGVETRFIKRDKRQPSGCAFILVDKDGKNRITVSPGSNSFLTPHDILGKAASIKASDIVLLQLEIPQETARTAINLAKAYSKHVILNPAPARKLNKSLLSKVDILIPNEIELFEMTGISSPKKAATLLLKAGVGCVIITLGKKGALLVKKGTQKFFKAKKVKVVDTTCAGDAFCGALAFKLDSGASVEESVEFANTAAALTVTKLGAQTSLPTLKEVIRIHKDTAG